MTWVQSPGDGLINEHKNAHGNAPVPPPPASLSRWRNPKLPAFHSQTAFSTSYSQQPSRDFSAGQANATTWRKKYSLVNTAPRPALSSATGLSPSTSWPSQSHASREAPEPQPMLSEATAISSVKAGAGLQAGSVAGDVADSGCQPGFSGWRKPPRGKLPAAPWPLNAGSSRSKETSASALSPLSRCKSPAMGGNHRPAAVQKKTLGRSELAASLGRTFSESAITLKSEPQRPLVSAEQGSGSLPTWKKPALQPSHLCGSHRQTCLAGTVKLSPAGSGDLPASCAPLGEEASSSSVGNPPPNKPTVVLVQKSSSLPASGRSSRFKRANYTWVANPSKLPRSVRRWAVASRASESTPKLALCTPAMSPKSQSRGVNLDLGAKPKKQSPHSKLAASSSQYKWKAASAKPPPTSASVFTWKRKEGAGLGDGPSTSFQALRRVPLGPGHLAPGSPRAFLGTSSFLNYKLRSWPKTVKRKGSTSCPTLLLKSRYCLRKRHAARGRSSPTARRTGTKGLVQISKHRLRRLPASRTPASPKEGPSFLLVTSPVPHRVVNTRYRLVKKSAGSPLISAAPGAGPAHGWKARRLSLSRSLLSNSTRHSLPGSKSQAAQHRWRNKGLRCIEGVMYRVSANKLSKTSSSPGRSMEVATRSYSRGAPRPDSAPGASGYSPLSWASRSVTSRYIASRAVQRSLAIIRQAKQRKDRKKEYCMYYNRFGKCNRGESCPYIHDPEKVAVCTRFLRGACKKTDGTCPFAHKISKDKMPVCSYFLKGICNNSDCPYSHVYVSRKAEVCPDFLKGYCPLGEKCKKKHTLVCPDFSKHGVCAKGSRCRLQHPQKKHLAKQAGIRDSYPTEQGNYAKETLRRSQEEEEEGATRGEACRHPRILPQSSRLSKQPSFIALQSPPASPEEQQGPRAERSGEEAGKPLQIKPRL